MERQEVHHSQQWVHLRIGFGHAETSIRVNGLKLRIPARGRGARRDYADYPDRISRSTGERADFETLGKTGLILVSHRLACAEVPIRTTDATSVRCRVLAVSMEA